jgi:hypothetical protein
MQNFLGSWHIFLHSASCNLCLNFVSSEWLKFSFLPAFLLAFIIVQVHCFELWVCLFRMC